MNKLKLAESIYILKESEDVYQIVFTSTRKIKRFGVDDLVKDMVETLKLEPELSELVAGLQNKYAPDNILSCLRTLESEGIVRSYDDRSINPRYKKQVLLIGELSSSREEALALQDKIEKSTIAVFGVGGIGTWIVNGLSQIGVGTIKISDPDTVTESNLNRQLYFTSEDIGKYKVEVIKEKVRDSDILPYKTKVSPEEDLEEIVSGCNLLVNCADSPSVADTSRIINKYARAHNLPYVIAGGYNLHLGMVGPIIIPGKTACLDCFLTYQKENDPLKDLEKIKDIKDTGSLGPIAGAVANIQVMEIFKFLTGKGSINVNRFAEIDFMNLNVEWREFNRREACINCAT